MFIGHKYIFFNWPLLLGFFVKMNVFLTTMIYSFYFFSIIAVLCSIISTFYYIRIIKILYFENLLVGKLYYPIKTVKTLILSILILILLFLFINSNFLNIIILKIVINVFPFFCTSNFTYFFYIFSSIE